MRELKKHFQGDNGGFLRKGGVPAMEVIEELATNSRGWSREKQKAERLDEVKRPCRNETSQESAATKYFILRAPQISGRNLF